MSSILEVLIESSVRAIVIATAIALVLWGMRVKSPAIRHHAWTGVLVVMLFLPFLSIWAPRIDIPVLPAKSELQEIRIQSSVTKSDLSSAFYDSSVPVRVPLSGKVDNRSLSSLNAFEIAIIFYLVGFSVFVVRLFAGMLLSYRLALKSPRDDRGFQYSQCTVPLTMGLLRPRILLPVESRSWDVEKLAAILIHEREHVRRCDPLVEWLAILNRSIYWFHPLAWWLCRKLATLAEQACDEAVIANGHDRSAYAELLLEFARSVKRRGQLITSWGSSIQGSTLALRVRRILNGDLSPSLSRSRLVLVTALCAAAILPPAIFELSRAQAAPSPPPAQTDNSDPQPDLSTLSHTALYKTGLVLLEKREFGTARLAFQTLINKFPKSHFAGWAYLAIGESFYNEGGTENLLRAEDRYRDFVVFFPTHPKIVDARMKIISIDMHRMHTSGFDKNAIVRADAELDTFLKGSPKSTYIPAIRQYREELSQELTRLQLTKITGYVTDPTADAIPGVSVFLVDKENRKGFINVTNDGGYFEIRGMPLDKNIELRFQKNGYETCSYAGADLQYSPLMVTMRPEQLDGTDLMEPRSFEQDLLDQLLIERIDIRGNRRIPKETIRFYIQSRPGEPYDKTRLGLDLQSIFRSNYFEHIEIQESDGEIGKIVTFIVKEKPIIR
jgi:hypothetical protein